MFLPEFKDWLACLLMATEAVVVSAGGWMLSSWGSQVTTQVLRAQGSPAWSLFSALQGLRLLCVLAVPF